MRHAAGEAQESRLQVRAQSEETEEEEEFARVFELPSLDKGAGTVAEKAQIRRTRHDDVSARCRRRMRSSSSKPRREQLEAEMDQGRIVILASNGSGIPYEGDQFDENIAYYGYIPMM